MGQPHVSDTGGHLWVEEGDRREGVVADVAPLIPTNRTYTFAVPETMAESLALGHRVRVPLGRRGRLVDGFVVGLDRRVWDSTLRPIASMVDRASFLSAELVELGREIALHYACPLGRTLKAMTPEAVRRERGLRTIRFARLKHPIQAILESGRRITEKRRRVLEALAGAAEPLPIEPLARQAGATSAVVRGMVREGWIELTTRKVVEETGEPNVPLVEPTFTLNEEQRQALELIHARIDSSGFFVTLLFGVSGSGKTEVYIRAIRRVVAAGRQAILLVPEIVLTTQLVGRLSQRFPDVAVSHSGLTDAERSLLWRQVASGDKKVVIGTRSAVFAPCPALGLICVDEEQETSYKNLQAPRFHVRDVAIMRGHRLGIPIVLGSATPSVETWYNSEHRSHYRRVRLKRRVKDLPLPDVHIVDMRDEYLEQKRMVVLSRLMERLLGETLRRGEQALILMNRRGYANRVFCPVCKTRIVCPNCSVNLVVHTARGRSLCHYCRAHVETPTVCPNVACGEPLIQTGVGTQRVEDVLARLHPSARIQRVDSDTMRHRDQYQRIVSDFEARSIDVLVGTQMIAKGLDFPFVSFVGVVHADTSALAADFRAHERLFQLITQVAGRAGRADASGRVVVQTTNPALPALRYALEHDYESFVAEELGARRRVGLPPFGRLARVVLAHPREETARRQTEVLYERVREAIEELALSGAEVIGPTPCLLSRLRGKYRYDLLVRTPSASSLRQLMVHLEQSNALAAKVLGTVVVDVDPVSLT
jgi:primosomal protein N' (replication factor Y)